MKKFLFAFFTLLFLVSPFVVRAAECRPEGYTTIFVNGILTSEENAKRSKDLLERRYLELGRYTGVNFILGYNPPHLAGLGDTLQVISQAIGSPVSNYDRNIILRQIHPEVTTQKILLVGHSQGTFYTNELYDYLITHGVPEQSITVYNLATPADYAADGDKYLTSTNDNLIRKVRELVVMAGVPQPLPANITIPVSNPATPELWRGHAFSEEYLAGAPARIVSDINAALDELTANDTPSTTDGCFVSPPETVTEKIQKVGFAVLDSAANTAVNTGTVIKDVSVATKDYAVATTQTVSSVVQNTARRIVDVTQQFFSNVKERTTNALFLFSENVPRTFGVRPDPPPPIQTAEGAYAAPPPQITDAERIAMQRFFDERIITPLRERFSPPPQEQPIPPPLPPPGETESPAPVIREDEQNESKENKNEEDQKQLIDEPIREIAKEILAPDITIPSKQNDDTTTEDSPPAEDAPTTLDSSLQQDEPLKKIESPRIIFSGGGGGSSSSGSSLPPPSLLPPSAITDLAVSNVATSTVMLTWATPTDPDTATELLRYDLRIATSTPIIDDATFDEATAVIPGPLIDTATTTASFFLTGLTASTTYSIAMRVLDSDDLGALSNVVTFTTDALPVVVENIPPLPVTDLSLTDNGHLTSAITLTWSAPDDPDTHYATSTPHLSYALRYATSSPILTEDDWSIATEIATSTLPLPAASSTPQSVMFFPMLPNTEHFFALRMFDGEDWSPISNTASTTTPWFGALTEPTIWSATSTPYYVTETLTVSAPLTIDPGVTVSLGDAASIVFDAPVTAEGTEADGITFTKTATSTDATWAQLLFHDGASSTLDRVTVEHGGRVDASTAVSMISLDGGDMTVQQSTFTNARGDAFSCSGAGAATLTQVTIRESGGAGIRAEFPCIPSTSFITFEQNTINAYTMRGTLDAALTIPTDIASVFDGVTVAASGSLLIPAGVTIWMTDDSALDVYGSFVSEGSSFAPVFLTSIHDATLGNDILPFDDTPVAPDDWLGVRFFDGASGVLGVITTFNAGGDPNDPFAPAIGISATNASLTFTESFLSELYTQVGIQGANATTTLTSMIEDIDPLLMSVDLWGDPLVRGTLHFVRIDGVDEIAEFVSIMNAGNGAEDLTGWTVQDESGKIYTFPDGFVFGVGATVMIHTGGDPVDNTDIDLYWGRGDSVWNNDGDTATLRDATGAVVDTFVYLEPAPF